MKHLLLVIAASVLNQNAIAEVSSSNVIAEHVMHVGFAPPEYRGTFKFQILKNGTVQTIDNKDKKVVVAKIAKTTLKTLVDGIDSIKDNELSMPQDPPCMDAPSEKVTVRQSKGETIAVWLRSGCRNSESSNSAAARSAQIVNSLQEAFRTITYIKD